MAIHLKDELYAVTDALTAAGIEYAICGGMAVIIYGYPRSTRDLDLIIREEDKPAAEDALRPLGYIIPAIIMPFDFGTTKARRVFRISRLDAAELFTLDLLLVTPFLEDVWEGREWCRVEGRRLRIVSRDGLKKMKIAAGRHRDLDDLERLGWDTE